MEHHTVFSSPVLRTLSLHSLTEGNEAISEAEEINEVKSLHVQGNQAAKTSNFSEAIKFYNDALEIDSRDVGILQARALAYLQQGKTVEALADAEAILIIDPNSLQGFLLKGVTYQRMNMFKASLDALLSALEVDSNNASKTTNYIVGTVAKMCQLSEEKAQTLKYMESYEKLSELGVLMFQNKKYEVCISVLEAARKFQTNQKGITLRILLTQANAHSQLLHIPIAIGLYQECYGMAVANHEQEYQTKALVNIATLQLENGDTHQAIIFYEKLLHLETEILTEAGPEGDLPEYWTKELQCGLHLNLSIAYKTIGNITCAMIHSKKYRALAQKYGLNVKLMADSHRNTGLLNEILGKYNEALLCYNDFLTVCKTSGDERNVGQAYGCLASVYASLKDWDQSICYHEQHIEVATKCKDRKMMAVAHEMFGDTLAQKEDYEQAINHYNEVLTLCRNRDNSGDATARCKIASAYRGLGQIQYSLYYYNEAVTLARRFGYSDIETLAEFNIALIHKDSTQYMDRDEAQKTFMKLIPYFEKKIVQHLEENSHCPELYEQQLTQCYDGMQTILSALSNKLGCLQYAEAHRKRSLITLPNFQLTCRADNHSLDSSREIWGTDHMKRIVSSQNATVLYYSLLENQLLIWVLAPGEGVVRFYSTKASTTHTFTQQITKLLSDMRADWDTTELLTTSEARALPLRDAEIQNLRLNNMKHYESKTKYKSTESENINSTITQTPNNDRSRGTNALSEESLNSKKTVNDSSCDFTEILNDSSSTGAETTTCLSDQEKIIRKPALRQLYEILISPVSDILENLKQGSHLVIVPDKVLNFCPFGALLDHQDKSLYERFSISYVSCLLLLDRVIQNELGSLSAEDALNVKRKQACGGGVAQYLSELPGYFHLHNANPDPDSADDTSDSTKEYQKQSINLKEVSNPRLVSYRPHVSPVQKSINMDKTRLELPGHSQTSESRSRSHSPRAEKSGEMASNLLSDHPSVVEKMLATHTYSTLCAETWTHTDVTSSSQVIPQFQQISDPRTALVFGCPWITQGIKIHDKEWRPKPDLIKAQSELMLVSQCLGTDPIVGEQATRQELLTSLETAEVIHIGTWACLRDGLLLVTPEPVTDQEDDTSHLVTISDILNVRLRAKLVVLSTCGLSPARAEQECPMKLAGSFLSAGAECVLVCKWPVPDDVLCKFLVNFYHTLQNSEFVSKALSNGVKAIREDNRWSHVCHWSGFMLVGKDTKVSLSDVRHAQLDQLIDKCETEAEETSGVPILNPKSSIPTFGSKEENLTMLQLHLKKLLRNHYKNPQVIPELFDLLDTALKRLHTMDSTKLPCQLTEHLAKNHQAMNLLKWLGFHFQAKEAKLSNPYIIFPHWNTDHLLIPTYDALKAASELTCSPACITAICEILPLSQDKISILIDLLTITKHASDIQLRVTDFSVHPLWHNTRTKALLTTTGFHQVGLLLSFNMVGMQKQLLVAMLQLLLSFSCYKSPVLLFKLDVNLLGHSSKARDPVIECPKLPSLMPLLLPRNQLRMSSPWLSVIEQKDEMQEKIKLARSATNLSEEYLGHLEKAKTWHHTTVTAQAKETLDKYGRPSSTPKLRVKVKPGSTPSEPRVPINYEKQLTPRVVRQRRDYAHFVLEERVENIDKRKKDNLVKLYLPYIHS